MSSLSTATLGWIALGVGASLILALIFGVVLGLRAFLRARSGGLPPGVLGAMPALRPTEIMAAVDAVPPLERARAAKAYRGMPLRWEVTLQSAFPSGLTTVRLMCVEAGTDYPWVMLDVRKWRYPALRGLPQGVPFRVVRRIQSVGINEIYVRQVSLEFD